MRLKRWQGIFFATSLLWGLVGTAIITTFFPGEIGAAVQTTVIKSHTAGADLTGQIFDPKYDWALKGRLCAGVGENEILNVIILLDQQNPQIIAAREAIQSIGGEVQYEYHLFQGISAAIPATALKTLAGFPAITRICDDYVETIPHDSAPSAALVDANNWWRSLVGAESVSQTGTGVNIAILDTGLGYEQTGGYIGYHLDLPLTRIVARKNFAMENDEVDPTYMIDWNGHGTHTAGIALGSGTASNGKYKGIAPAAGLLVGRVLNSSGAGEFSGILKGLEWAVDSGADIVSMSLGGGGPEVFSPDGLAIQNATQHNVLVVASAGNSGPGYFSGGSPGSLLYTLSVGASDRDNKLADFSSVGPTWAMQSFPSIIAPGVDIIAPLGSNSYIEEEEAYLQNVMTGLAGSDYVPLSGTSMSAPVVAGAAALLLQAYPLTNATTLRIALMESATDLNFPSIRQGSGLVNIPAAMAYLAALNPSNNATQVYPKQVPFEPYDLLQFPGDAQTMNLTVVSGIARNISIQLPDLASEGVLLSTPKSAVNFTNAGVQLWNLTIQIDWNASAGAKTGLINFTDGKTGEILDQVALDITITLPKRRVYFDSFHGLNDYFDGVPYGTPQYELYNLVKAFTLKNYSVDLKMEYWTPGYSPSRDGRLLTYDLLQNYDAVVLQTPSLPYTPTELQALVDFRTRNGSILIIGDRHQSLAVDSVNALLVRLNAGISFLTDNLEYVKFYGMYGLASSFLINTATSTDPILTGVQSLVFDRGALLNTSGAGASVLNASIFGLTIVAKSTGTGTAGNVVAISGPSFLTNGYMTDPDHSGNHTRFASNLIDYLLPEQAINIARKVAPERSVDGITKTYLYVTNGSTGTAITGLVSGTDLNLTVSNSSGFGEFIVVNEEPLAPGVYVNSSYTLPYAVISPYLFNTSVSVNVVQRNATGAAIRTNSNPPVFLSTSQDADAIARGGFYNDQTLHLQSSVILNYKQVYCGSTPLSIFNTHNQYSFNYSLSGVPSNYQVPFTVAPQKTSGVYSYFFEGNNTAGFTNVNSNRDYFQVVNYDPVISESLSYFDQLSFSSMKSGGGYIPQYAKQLEAYTFSVAATEQVSYEDFDSQLDGVVVYIPSYILNNTVGLMIGSGDLPYERLSYTSSSDRIEGTIEIPATITTPKGDGTNLEKSTVSSGDYVAIFEVAIMDSDGGYSDYIVILNVMAAVDPLMLALLFIAVFAGIGVLIYVLYRRHRTQMSGGYGARYKSVYEGPSLSSSGTGYGYESEHQVSPPTQLRKFCPYCGQAIPLDAYQCPYCAAKIPGMDEF